MEKLKDHPNACPNCKAEAVLYERIALSRGEYVCDECGWGMDALSGKITASGEKVVEISLHHQQSKTNIPLMRVDYSSTHVNPEEIIMDLPEKFHPYAGMFFTHNDHHIHYHVDGYKPLAWAIPIADLEFPVKEIDNNQSLSEQVSNVISSFADLINIQTSIILQPVANI